MLGKCNFIYVLWKTQDRQTKQRYCDDDDVHYSLWWCNDDVWYMFYVYGVHDV